MGMEMLLAYLMLSPSQVEQGMKWLLLLQTEGGGVLRMCHTRWGWKLVGRVG